MPRANPEVTKFPLCKTTTKYYGVITNTIYTDLYASALLCARTRSYSSSKTPGYAGLSSRQKKKLLPTFHGVDGCSASGSAYILNRVRAADNYPYYEEIVDNCASKLSSMPQVGPAIQGSWIEDARSKARARAASQLNSLKMNVAQAFAERKQTAQLLAGTATRILQAARCVKRADLWGFVQATGLSAGQGTVKHFKDVAKTPPSQRLARHWLELQYGWKPLLQDAYGAAELLASHISNERFNTTVKGQATSGYTNVIKGAYPNPTQIGKVTIKAKLGLQFVLDSNARARLAQTGIDNPALLAWELLPFSFVVDWFLPVGNYLEALNAFSGFEFVSGWSSSLTRWEGIAEYSGRSATVWNGSFYEYTMHGGSYVFQSYKYERSRLDTIPSALPPSFKNPIGGEPITRLLTATALLAQLFGK